jgi:hypothetical protein
MPRRTTRLPPQQPSHPPGRPTNPATPEQETHLATGTPGHRTLTACGIWTDNPHLPTTTDPADVTCVACSELDAAVTAARNHHCPTTDTCRIPLTDDTLRRAGCPTLHHAHDLGLCAALYAQQTRDETPAQQGGQP